MMAERQIPIFKDDGCNTKVMSESFMDKNGGLSNISRTNIKINHLDDTCTEKASKIVVNAEVQIENFT